MLKSIDAQDMWHGISNFILKWLHFYYCSQDDDELLRKFIIIEKWNQLIVLGSCHSPSSMKGAGWSFFNIPCSVVLLCVNSYNSWYIYVTEQLNGIRMYQFPLGCQFDRYQDTKLNVHVEINWRNVPKNLLNDSWFLCLTRNWKRLQKGWIGNLLKDLFEDSYCQAVSHGYPFCRVALSSNHKLVTGASMGTLRDLRHGSILGNLGAGEALWAEPEDAAVLASACTLLIMKASNMWVFSWTRSGSCWRETHERMFWVLLKIIT